MKAQLKRKRNSDQPREISKKRSQTVSQSIPENWSVESVQWVLARIAVAKGIHAPALAESIFDLTTRKFQHHKQPTEEYRLKRDLAKVKDVLGSTDSRALSGYLRGLETEVLYEVISDEINFPTCAFILICLTPF